jgi:catechol 2,3-dioxygenase-like lactoylglutathione lyase family enzyme
MPAMSNAFPAGAKVGTFLATRDRAKAKAFFADTLGFRAVHEDDYAIVFDLNGTHLRISAVKDFAPQPFTVLGWGVPDIAAAVRALKAKGVAFNIYDGMGQDELGIWTVPGGTIKVAWFHDPDKNVLSLTQF